MKFFKKSNKSKIISLKQIRLKNQFKHYSNTLLNQFKHHSKILLLLIVLCLLTLLNLYSEKFSMILFKEKIKESDIVQENKIIRNVTNQVTNKRILPGLFLSSYYHFDSSTTNTSTTFRVNNESKELSPLKIRLDLFHNLGVNKTIQITYTSVSINHEKNEIRGILDFTSFSNPKLSKDTESFLGQGYCIGELVRGDKNDNDKLTCNGVIQQNIVTRVTHQIGKDLTITFKLIDDDLVGYFSSSNGVQTELGRFSVGKTIQLSKQIVVSLSSLESIRDCSELKPTEVSILKVTNKGQSSFQTQLKKDMKFECSKKTNEVKTDNLVKFIVQ